MKILVTIGALAVLVGLAVLLVPTNAAGQWRTPRVSTPRVSTRVSTPRVPRVSTPRMPRVSTPRVSTTRMPRVSTPRVGTPRMPRVSTPRVGTTRMPRVSTPRVGTPRMPRVSTPRVPRVSQPRVSTPRVRLGTERHWEYRGQRVGVRYGRGSYGTYADGHTVTGYTGFYGGRRNPTVYHGYGGFYGFAPLHTFSFNNRRGLEAFARPGPWGWSAESRLNVNRNGVTVYGRAPLAVNRYFSNNETFRWRW